MYDDIAGKELGHAGGVIVHHKFFQLDGKGQILQQHARRLRQDHGRCPPPFRDQQIASERGIVNRQPVLGRHIGNQPAAAEHRLTAEPHLCPHNQVAIQQATDANQHDRTVCRQVPQFIGHAHLGCHHPTFPGRGRTRLQLDAPTRSHQSLADATCLGLRISGQSGFSLVSECLQALLTDVFLEGAQIIQDFGRVAHDAQTGADHQKGQNQQEPPCAVHRIQVQLAEDLRPERTELVDVVVDGLLLLQHGPNDRCDADDGQQRNGKPHGGQQFDPVICPAGALTFNRFVSGHGHSNRPPEGGEA